MIKIETETHVDETLFELLPDKNATSDIPIPDKIAVLKFSNGECDIYAVEYYREDDCFFGFFVDLEGDQKRLGEAEFTFDCFGKLEILQEFNGFEYPDGDLFGNPIEVNELIKDIPSVMDLI